MNLRSVSELATALFPPDYLQDSLIDEIQMVQKKLTHLRETPGPSEADPVDVWTILLKENHFRFWVGSSPPF